LAKTAAEEGFTSILLVNKYSLGAACVSTMAGDLFGCLPFPVIKHQGYRQKSDDLSGGTGCFVLLVGSKARGLPALKETQPNTILPKVEFSLRDSCFYSSPPPILLDEEEVNLLTPDFFACLSTFVETDDASTLWCTGGEGNEDVLSALRPFLCSLRHCVVLDRSTDEPAAEKLTFKTEEVLVEASTLLTHTTLPKNVEGVCNVLPLNGDSQSKVSKARFYDGLVQSGLMESKAGFGAVCNSLFEKVGEERHKAEQRLANAYLPQARDDEDAPQADGKEKTAHSLRNHLLPRTWMDPKLLTLGEVEKKAKEKTEGKKKESGKKRKRGEGKDEESERPRKKAKKDKSLESEEAPQESVQEEGSGEEKSS